MKKFWLLCFLVLFSSYAENKKMNVLFIAVDDLRPELGCYGVEQVHSPNIDRLASEGVLFDRAYTQQAVCGPSRVSLLSGTRPTGVWELPQKYESSKLATMPHHFKMNGYKTLSVGKIYHKIADDPQGWSEKPWDSSKQYTSWHSYVDPNSLEIQKKHKEAQKKKPKGRTTSAGPSYEMPNVSDNAYRDGKNADYAIEKLREIKDEPFFMMLGFAKPHLPFNAPKKYWDLYQEKDFTLPDSKLPKNAPAYALDKLIKWDEMRAYPDIPNEGHLSDEYVRKLKHGYYACVSYIDALVGKVLKELDTLKLRDNTIVVLWSDHGWKLGEYGAWCKHTNYELDTRIPLIISIPGKKSDVNYSLVETVDLAPTLAEYCGIEVKEHWEGNSLKRILDNPQATWKDAVFSQYMGNSDGKKAMGYSIRTKEWRYTEWVSKNKVVGRELYDHRQGQPEKINIAGLPEFGKIIESLSLKLNKGNGWQQIKSSMK